MVDYSDSYCRAFCRGERVSSGQLSGDGLTLTARQVTDFHIANNNSNELTLISENPAYPEKDRIRAGLKVVELMASTADSYRANTTLYYLATLEKYPDEVRVAAVVAFAKRNSKNEVEIRSMRKWNVPEGARNVLDALDLRAGHGAAARKLAGDVPRVTAPGPRATRIQ